MGNNNQQLYNEVLPGTKAPGFTSIYRKKGIKELTGTPQEKLKNLSDVLLHIKEKYGDRDGLGQIIVQKQIDQDGKEVQTRSIKPHTYNEVYETSHNLGKVLDEKEYFFKEVVQGMKLIGIYSKNRYQWYITDWACIQFGLTIVPLYDTLGVQNLSYCLRQTQITTLFVTAATARILLGLKDLGNLKRIISFDKLDEQTIKNAKSFDLQILDYQQLITLGAQIKNIDNGHINIQYDQIFTFSYTSGTTGPPKGALMSHGNFLSFLASIYNNQDMKPNKNDRHLSYLPLPHLMERCLSLMFFFFGAYVIISSGNLLKLKDDYMIAKPTMLISVPRVLNRIAQNIKAKFEAETGVKKWLIDRAVDSKLYYVKTQGSYTNRLYDKLIFSKVRESFGGNIRLIASGSAPINPEIQAFLKIVFCCPYIQAYGQTQNTAAIIFGRGEDADLGSMCQFGSGVQVKLADIPQMKYTSQDKNEQGILCPRGEIWVRGPQIFKGYYKLDEITMETITKDRWLKSGDVGQINSQKLSLKIIDRKKNIFKLSQGQYIAPDKVENVYTKSHLISEIFLHGQSSQSFTVAVATPNKDSFMTLASSKNIAGSFEDLCSNKQMRTLLLIQLNLLGRKQGLTGFEVAKNIHLETVGFLSRKILTNTMKLIRFQAKQYYKDDIVRMYKEGQLQLK